MKTDGRLKISSVVLGLSGLIVMSSMYLMIPITNYLAEFFQSPGVTIALSTSFFSLAYAVGVMVFGPMSGKVEQKRMMLLGVGALAVVTLAIGIMSSIQVVLVLRAIQGFVAAIFSPMALAYIFEVYPLEKRTFTTAVLTTGFLMAGVVGQIFSTWITQLYGWTYVFFLLAVTYLLLCFCIWQVLPLSPVKQIKISLFNTWRDMGSLLTKTNLLLAYFISFSLFVTFVGVYASLGEHLTTTYRLTAGEILGVRAAGILGIMVSLTAGWLANRHGQLKVIIAGLIVAVVGIIMLRFQAAISLLIIASVIFVAGISLVVPVIINFIGTMGGAQRGEAVALYILFLFMGASVGPLLTMLESFAVINTIILAVLLISLVFSLILKPVEVGVSQQINIGNAKNPS